MVIHYPAKFNGHGHCGNGDIMVLVFHIILEEHIIKRLCNFAAKSTSRQVTILPSMVTINTVVAEIYWFYLATRYWKSRDQKATGIVVINM